MAGDATNDDAARAAAAQAKFNAMFETAMDAWWEKEKSKRTGGQGGDGGTGASGGSTDGANTDTEKDGIHNLWGLFKDPVVGT